MYSRHGAAAATRAHKRAARVRCVSSGREGARVSMSTGWHTPACDVGTEGVHTFSSADSAHRILAAAPCVVSTTSYTRVGRACGVENGNLNI